VAVSNVLHQQWAKDQSRFHLFMKYFRNRKTDWTQPRLDE
jgi:hypothetical protein